MWKAIYPIFNECILSPYHPPKFPSQKRPPPPPPDLVEGFEEQEIEEILDSRLRKNQLEYLIHWKGFPWKEREWKTAAELPHAQDAITDFRRAHPTKPRPIPTMHLRFRPIENLTQPTHVPGWLYNWEDGTFERNERWNRSSAKEEEKIWYDALESLPDRETRSLEGG